MHSEEAQVAFAAIFRPDVTDIEAWQARRRSSCPSEKTGAPTGIFEAGVPAVVLRRAGQCVVMASLLNNSST